MGNLSDAIAKVAATTAAAPLISDFISPMPSAGFSAYPPESKVIPLPTKAIRFFGLAGA